jgi:hypothetical protein
MTPEEVERLRGAGFAAKVKSGPMVLQGSQGYLPPGNGVSFGMFTGRHPFHVYVERSGFLVRWASGPQSAKRVVPTLEEAVQVILENVHVSKEPPPMADYLWLRETLPKIEAMLTGLQSGALLQFTMVRDPEYVPLKPGWGSLCGGVTKDRAQFVVMHFRELGWECTWNGDSETIWFRFSKRRTVYDWLNEP